jgi:hypothetical protein
VLSIFLEFGAGLDPLVPTKGSGEDSTDGRVRDALSRLDMRMVLFIWLSLTYL